MVFLLVSSILAMALESAGALRIAGYGRLVSIGVMASGSAIAGVSSSWLPVAIATALSQVGVQFVQVLGAGRAGFLDSRVLVAWYSFVAVAACGLMGLVWLLGRYLSAPVIPAAAVVALLYLGGLAWMRRRVPPLGPLV